MEILLRENRKRFIQVTESRKKTKKGMATGNLCDVCGEQNSNNDWIEAKKKEILNRNQQDCEKKNAMKNHYEVDWEINKI